MSNFVFLKPYVVDENNADPATHKHSFFTLSQNDIANAEVRMALSFPIELREFYGEIGHGFIGNLDKQGVNRMMDPGSVADFRLGEGLYEHDPDREMYEDINTLVFFEVSEGTYLTIRLDKENADGQCPVYYFDTEIATSLECFIRAMDKKTDYYL